MELKWLVVFIILNALLKVATGQEIMSKETFLYCLILYIYHGS